MQRQIEEALQRVLGKDAPVAQVSFGEEAGRVHVSLVFAPAVVAAERFALEDRVRAVVAGVPGVVDVSVSSRTTKAAAAAAAPAAPSGAGCAGGHGGHGPGVAPEPAPLAGVGRVILVCSGKGGVGKSTVATNLAYATARMGYGVGLLDLDVHGPSLPTLLGMTRQPMVRGERIQPIEHGGVGVMSLGFVIEAGQPVIWRGPMVASLVKQFLREVAWEGRDYLFIDMPPGTGDAYLTVLQEVKVDGAVVVTTPSELALADVGRGVGLFKPFGVEILGVVENMSHFDWPGATEMARLLAAMPHDGAHGSLVAEAEGWLEAQRRVHIFGDAAEQMIAALGLRLLGRIPLDPQVRALGDGGEQVVTRAAEGVAGQAFRDVAQRLVEAKPAKT